MSSPLFKGEPIFRSEISSLTYDEQQPSRGCNALIGKDLQPPEQD
jgi:hypothetical protein